jgi:hypothetical protein
LAKRSSPNKDKEDEDSDEGQDGNQEFKTGQAEMYIPTE